MRNRKPPAPSNNSRWSTSGLTDLPPRSRCAKVSTPGTPCKEATARTILRRLEIKGYVTHRLDGRTYVYTAKMQPENVAMRRTLLGRIRSGAGCRNGGTRSYRSRRVAGTVQETQKEEGVSQRALLLGAIGMVAAFIARRRRAEIQHAIWSAVLVGMLALPFLTAALPRIPLRSTQIVSTPASQPFATVPTPKLATPTITRWGRKHDPCSFGSRFLLKPSVSPTSTILRIPAAPRPECAFLRTPLDNFPCPDYT
jgi:hypothetical protein